MAQTPNVTAVRRHILGRGAAVVTGPAGIGKSRFAARVMSGSSHLMGQALPTFDSSTYRPLRHALRAKLDGSPADVATEIVWALRGRALWLEDVHWADAGTMAVVELLVGRVPLLVTSRSTVELCGHPSLLTISVPPLTPRAAETLSLRLHPMLDAAQRARLLHAASGNPLLLDRLVAGSDVTSTLAEALAARIRALPPAALEPLGRLALQGYPSTPELIDLNGAAEESGLLTVDGGHVWFDHELFADTLLDQIDPALLVRLRLDLINRCDDIDAARHLHELGDSAAAAQRALRAAGDVTSQSQRADLLVLAVRMLGSGAPGEVRLAAAGALIKAHRADDAEAVLAGLSDVDVDVTAEADLYRAQAAWLRGDAPSAFERLDRALAVVGGTGSRLEARVIVERAAIFVRVRVGDATLPAVAMRAMEVANCAGVERARATNLAGLALSHSGLEGWAERFREAAALARAAGDIDEECAAQYWLASSLGFYGPMLDALRLGTVMLDRTRDLGLRRWFLMFLGARAVHLCATGGLSDADVDACRQLLADEPTYRNRAQVQLVIAVGLVDRGRFDDAQKVIDEGLLVARDREDSALVLCAAVELAAARGDRQALLAALTDLVATGAGFFGLNATAESAALHGLVQLDDTTSPLPVFSNRLTPVLDVVLVERSAHGLWAAGDLPAAIDRFADAAAEWDRRGLRRYGWRALATAAELAIRCGDLDGASAMVTELTQRPPVQGSNFTSGLAALRASLGAARIERALTPRQATVLRLVGTGMSSADIAAHLGITVATVNAHVNAALRELGCRTRRQAAALLRGAAA